LRIQQLQPKNKCRYQHWNSVYDLRRTPVPCLVLFFIKRGLLHYILFLLGANMNWTAVWYSSTLTAGNYGTLIHTLTYKIWQTDWCLWLTSI